MRIRYVRIQSYRGLADVSFPVGEGATLVGKNNAGKSSILEALGWFFRRDVTDLTRRETSALPREDAYTWHEADGVGEDSKQFEDADAFPDRARSWEWLEGRMAEDIRITLAFSDIPTRAYLLSRLPRHVLPDAATDEPLLVLGRRYSYGLLAAEVRFDPARCVSTLSAMAGPPDEWKELARDEAFLVEHFMIPDFVMLEARSPDYGEWLRQAIAPLAARTLDRAFAAHNINTQLVGTIITEARDALMTHVEQALSHAIGDAATNHDTADVDPGNMLDVLSELARAPRIQIPQSLGDGTQRQLLLAALRLYENKELWQPDDSLILAIEEPELFLHPAAQRSLREAIERARVHGIQTFVSTHSAAMVDRTRLDDVLLVHAQAVVDGPGPARRFVRALREDPQFRYVLEALGQHPKDVMDARCAVLVEGKSDKDILEAWAYRLGHDLEGLGIVIVASGGNQNVPLLSTSRIFGEYGVPYVVVLDGDVENEQSRSVIEQVRESGARLMVWGEACIENYLDLETVESYLRLPRGSIDRALFRRKPDEAIDAALERAKLGFEYHKTRHGLHIAGEMPVDRIGSDIRALFDLAINVARGNENLV